jgi:FG-GAP-like repeat/IPT/TIG domain
MVGLLTSQLSPMTATTAAAIGPPPANDVWFHSATYSVPDQAANVAVGSLTMDTLPDIVGGATDGKVSVLRNKGDGTFAASAAYVASTAYGVQGVAIADVNGDKRPDVIASIPDPTGASGIAVLLGNGDGTLQAPIYSSTTVADASYQDTPTTVAVRDFNRDGKIDVALGFRPGGANHTVLRVFNGDGTGHFQQFGSAYGVTDTYGAVDHLTVADLTGDGAPDIVASNSTCGYNGGNIVVLVNQGNGLFTATQSGLQCPSNVVVGDFNNDKIPDLATTTGVVLRNGRSATVLLGKDDGTFPTTKTTSVAANPNVAVAGDFNRDGKVDLVAGGDGGNLVTSLGNGDGTFQPAILFPDGSNNGDLASADLNGDGAPDIVAVGRDVTVAINQVPVKGQALIAGTVKSSGSPLQGSKVQACPTNGNACLVSDPTDSRGQYGIQVAAGSYAITAFPPPGTNGLSPKAVGPVEVQQGATAVELIDLVVNPMPPQATLTSPSGTQQGVAPSLHWTEPSTYKLPGQCTGGFGVLHVSATNNITGQSDLRTVPLIETPAGSGTYVGELGPLAPLHGVASGTQSITCPGRSSVLPDGGEPTGGTSVLLAGSGFTGASRILFGSSTAISFRVLSDDLITAVSPSGTGTVPVSVTTASGSAAVVGTYHYFSVTEISPNAGPIAGGQTVSIKGEGFTNVRGVMFGLLPATSFSVISPSEIQAVSPIGLGTVDIQVVSGFAVSQPVQAALYSYQGGPPGASIINEGTGETAPATLATQITTYCGSAGGIDFGPFCDVAKDSIADSVSEPLKQAVVAAILTLGPAALLDLPLDAVLLGVAVGFFVYDLFKFTCQHTSFCPPPFNILIDPSGNVVDTSGNPVSGATVSLLNQSASGGLFALVPPSSGSIVPATNPETTGGTGAFHWDAVTGTYEVQATKAQCHAPGIPSRSDVTTSSFTLPPPVVGLTLTLECPGTSPTPPSLTAVLPNAGPIAGGTVVTLVGNGLASTRAVLFGKTPAASFKVLSPYAVLAIAPPGNSVADLTVTTAGGSSPIVAADKYFYFNSPAATGAPSISSVTPNRGPSAGGTLVSIKGSGLAGVFAVTFGDILTFQVHQISSTEVQAVAPAAITPGPVDITMVGPKGRSTSTLADKYLYSSTAPNGAPAVMSLSPTSGPETGGTVVTIAGSSLTGATDVKFGPHPAKFTVTSDTSITATSPAGKGMVHVTVTTPAGVSAAVSADRFTYKATEGPAVTSISPHSGSRTGGDLVLIVGRHLHGVTSVHFGSESAKFLEVPSLPDVIFAVTPPGSGTVDVTVTSSHGTSDKVAADRFTYIDCNDGDTRPRSRDWESHKCDTSGPAH